MSFLLPQPMPQKASCKLPSIHSLQLDLPLSLPPIQAHQSQQNQQLAQLPKQAYTNATVAAGASAVSSMGSAASVLKPLASHVAQPSVYSRTPPIPTSYYAGKASSQEAHNFKLSPSPKSNAQPYISPVSSPSSSDANFKAESTDSENEKRAHSWSESQEFVDDDSHSRWKPRKKRQCPECKLFFSNLATHKSTHLKPTARPHVCKFCCRGFARPNDLFRHIKCHWKETGSDKGQFKCPYKNHSTGDHCGHSSGIFSRCDTFKNHLKAIHFQYPSGTKKDQRNKSNGSCRMCHQNFSSVEDWLTNHIEKGECAYANEFKKT